ncbi:hypothetical protein [Planomonospora sp. ID82291]|uniref:hypothetical protein n=1 Tax=Planomonospora sp. ID82291 TaxID=2738136 RepID=UPI0018C380CE|nr:hypothetical protein [Planomonospora sp. ID82291]MBG0818011.1 hypothetical protein [Planomonospora sp. ID82291]
MANTTTAAAPAIILSLAVSLLAGCSGRGAPPPAGASAPPPPSGSAAPPERPPEPPSAEETPTLELPADRQTIVPVSEGRGPSEVPAFQPVGDVYTIYFACTGGGAASLRARPVGKDNPARCDGTQTHGIIIHDGGPQRVEIRAGSHAAWKLAVLDGTPPWAEIG